MLARQHSFQEAWKALMEAKEMIDASTRCVDQKAERHHHALLQLGHELNEATENWLTWKKTRAHANLRAHQEKEEKWEGEEKKETEKNEEERRYQQQERMKEKQLYIDPLEDQRARHLFGQPSTGEEVTTMNTGSANTNTHLDLEAQEDKSPISKAYVSLSGLPQPTSPPSQSARSEASGRRAVHDADERIQVRARFSDNIMFRSGMFERPASRQAFSSCSSPLAAKEAPLCLEQKGSTIQETKIKLTTRDIPTRSDFVEYTIPRREEGIQQPVRVTNDTLSQETLFFTNGTSSVPENSLYPRELPLESEKNDTSRHGVFPEPSVVFPREDVDECLVDGGDTLDECVSSEKELSVNSIFNLGEPQRVPLYAFEVEKPRPVRADIHECTSDIVRRPHSSVLLNCWVRAGEGRNTPVFAPSAGDKKSTVLPPPPPRGLPSKTLSLAPSCDVPQRGDTNERGVENNVGGGNDGGVGGNSSNGCSSPQACINDEWRREPECHNNIGGALSKNTELREPDSSLLADTMPPPAGIFQTNQEDNKDGFFLFQRDKDTLTTEATFRKCFDGAKNYQEASVLHQQLVGRLLVQREREEREEFERGPKDANKRPSRASHLLGRLEEAYYDWLVGHLGIKRRCWQNDDDSLPSTASMTSTENTAKNHRGNTPQTHTESNEVVVYSTTPPRPPRSQAPAGRLEAALTFGRAGSFSGTDKRAAGEGKDNRDASLMSI